MKDLHVLIPDDDYEWLRLVAFQSRRSLAQVVREIIEIARDSSYGENESK